MTEEQKKSNRRLALIIASIAVALFLGFMAKGVMLSHGG